MYIYITNTHMIIPHDIRDNILVHQSYAVSQYYYISAQLLAQFQP